MAHTCLAMFASSHPLPLYVRSLARDSAGDIEGETRHGHSKANIFHRIFAPSSQASIIEVVRFIIFINPSQQVHIWADLKLKC
jgi:hypothetical protein